MDRAGVMNPKWFGDSYDIVKRFFAQALRELDYEVFIDPMLTGPWNGAEERLYQFLGMRPMGEYQGGRSALFLDPDTGIRRTPSKRHTTIEQIAKSLHEHEIVFCFDQSFSRGKAPLSQMLVKLNTLREAGGFGFYFDSHARFLFASSKAGSLECLRQHLANTGMPDWRFVTREGADEG